MINLIKNELYKIFHKKGIYIVLIINVIFSILVNFILSKIDDLADTVIKFDITWQQEYVEELEKDGDIKNEEYVSAKSQLDYDNFVNSLDENSWQRYILENEDSEYGNKLSNLYYQIVAYEVGYDKNKEEYDEAKKEKENIISKFKNITWQEYAEEEINILTEELKQQDDINTIAYLKAKLEKLELRLKYNIIYANNSMNNILDDYENNRNIELIYQNQDYNTLNDSEKKELETATSEVKIAKYKLENKIEDVSYKSCNAILQEFYSQYSIIIIVMIVLISGSIVSEEFSKGTIKLLLVRPYSRTKILMSKFITTLIMILFSILSTFLIQMIIGGIFFGYDSLSVPIVIYNFQTLTISEINIFQYFFYHTIAVLPQFILLSTLSFCLSTIFLNTALANTLTIIGMFGSDIINTIASSYEISILKYFVTLNWDFTPYLFGGSSLYQGITLPLSIGVCIIYFLIMIIASIIVFKKRNIKNI